MGLIDFLDRLRAKPAPVRRNILWVTTISLWLLIVGVWWTVVNLQPSERNLVGLGEALSPFRALGKTVSVAKDTVLGASDEVLNDSVATGSMPTESIPALDSATTSLFLNNESVGDIEWSGGASTGTIGVSAPTSSDATNTQVN